MTDFPNFRTREDAQYKFLREVCLKAYKSRLSATNENIMKIAKHFNQYMPWKISLTVVTVSFCISALLHMAYAHNVKRRVKLTSHFTYLYEKKKCFIKTMPIVGTRMRIMIFSLRIQNNLSIRVRLSFQWKKNCWRMTEDQKIMPMSLRTLIGEPFLRGFQQKRHRGPDAMKTMPTNLTANAPINDTANQSPLYR